MRNKNKYEKENETQTIPEAYGLRYLNCSLPQVKELFQFERNLLNMIKSLKF